MHIALLVSIPCHLVSNLVPLIRCFYFFCCFLLSAVEGAVSGALSSALYPALPFLPLHSSMQLWIRLVLLLLLRSCPLHHHHLRCHRRRRPLPVPFLFVFHSFPAPSSRLERESTSRLGLTHFQSQTFRQRLSG